MSDNQGFFRDHPDDAVRLVLNTEPAPEQIVGALAALPQPVHSKVQALTAILLAEAGVRSFDEAGELAQTAYREPSHVDLHLLFLASWYGLLASQSQAPEHQTRALEGSMNALITDNTPPEIRGIVCMVKAHALGYQGDFRGKFELIGDLLRDIPVQSPWHRKLGALRAMGFLGHGRGTIVEQEVEQKRANEFDEKGVFVTQLANSVLTGKLVHSTALLEKISTFLGHTYVNILRCLYESSCSLLEMMYEAQGVKPPSILTSACTDANAHWTRSTRALLERNPEEALFWARKFADEERTRAGEPIVFLDYTLVRAELAMKNGRAAKRLLLQLEDRGTESLFSSFYFARAELLLGDEGAASEHFSRLQHTLTKYDAEGRLDFEFALARELPIGALLRFGTKATATTVGSLESTTTKREVKTGLCTIVSESSQMEQVKNSITQYAGHELPVLITGETGTGKELVARALHDISPRAEKPFIAINCGAIPDALIESELFGHAAGAFTGARTAYKGVFREAEDGTVFLDEIADISPRLQTALLRVLEMNEVRPVGSSTHYEVRCRILAATNEELLSLVEAGKFRKDLYFRLQRLEIYLPPLRDRAADVSVLANHFLNVDRDEGEEVSFEKELVERLEQYPWPGNIRELRNVLERMRVLSSDKLDYTLGDLLQSTRLFSDEPTPNVERAPTASTSKSSTQSVPAGDDKDLSPNELRKMLSKGSTTFRRQRRLKELFQDVGELKVSEAAAILGVTPHTASRYMSALCKEGFIEKVTPTASPKSHYYARRIGESA